MGLKTVEQYKGERCTELVDRPISTPLIMPSLSLGYEKKYFVVNLETAKTADVFAKTPDEACDIMGWFRINCFVKMMVPEVTY